MPLNWLGQLQPTMEQQIALQRALLALAKEVEATRAVETVKTPALARSLGAAPIIPYAGPTSAFEKEPAFKGGMEYSPITRAPSPLAQALAPVAPTAEEISPEEKRATAKEELANAAGEFWTRIEPLDDASEKVALNACKRYQPALYRAMIEQGYVDKTTGAAVRKEVIKKPMTRDTHVEDGWLYEDVLYDDGTSTHQVIGRAPVEEAVTEPTISESIALEKLGIELREYAERHRDAAIKAMGPMPAPGITVLTINGKDVVATPEHMNAWLEGVLYLTEVFAAQAGEAPITKGEVTMSKAQAEFEGSTGAVKLAIQQKLGVPQTGEWDEATEFAFETYGEVLLGEKPAGEKVKEVKPKVKGYTPEMLARQKEFWDKWARVFKVPEGIIKAIKGVK